MRSYLAMFQRPNARVDGFEMGEDGAGGMILVIVFSIFFRCRAIFAIGPAYDCAVGKAGGISCYRGSPGLPAMAGA